MNGDGMHDAGRADTANLRELREYDMDKRMRALELQQATMHAALMHIPEKLDKLADAVAAMAQRPAQNAPPNSELTGIALAMQRTLDRMEKQPQSSTAAEMLKLLNTQPPGSGGKTWALVGALAVVAAMLAYQAFLG